VATALMGDPIAANMFMLGIAWQHGWVPVSQAAIERAIEINGIAVDFNRKCFQWGRRAAHDRAAVLRQAAPAGGTDDATPRETVDDIVAARAEFLTAYQDAAFAHRYRARVTRVREAERRAGLPDRLSRAVALQYFRLLAVKDEWEVARLFAAPEFRRELEATFEGDYRLSFHIGAWPFVRRDPATGTPRKGEAGPWLMPVFRLLARFRRWRGTWLDPFRGSPERRLDRELLADYEVEIDRLVAGLDARSYDLAVRLAALPEKIRGYGHVRAAAAAAVAGEREILRGTSSVAVRSAATVVR
jgi:indolepyruvate ferredoxin oxidoreductase